MGAIEGREVVMTSEQLLRTYAQQIRNLRDDEELDLCALSVLTTRDLLAAAVLTEEQRARLQRLDQKLILRQALLAEVLPFPSQHPPDQWWWYLHQRPQVREQAKVAA